MIDYIILYSGVAVICLMELFLLRSTAQELELLFPGKYYLVAVLIGLTDIAFLKFFYGFTTYLIVRYLFLLMILGVCGWTDFRKKLIFNRILLAGLIVFIFLSVADFFILGFLEWKFRLLSAFFGVLLLGGGSLLCRLVAPKGICFGDIKLLMVVGMLAGSEFSVNLIFCTFIIMFVVLVVLLLLKKIDKKTEVPFAPFLLVGTLAASVLTGI